MDVHRFRELVAAGDIEEAATKLRGDFLEGFFVTGAPAFEDWRRAEADGLRRELGAVLSRARHRARIGRRPDRALEAVQPVARAGRPA